MANLDPQLLLKTLFSSKYFSKNLISLLKVYSGTYKDFKSVLQFSILDFPITYNSTKNDQII